MKPRTYLLTNVALLSVVVSAHSVDLSSDMKRFKESGNIYEFKDRIAQFESHQANAKPEDALHQWVAILNVLEEKIDPAFNEGRVPFRNIEPPAGSGAQAGQAPESVKDPELRKQYIDAINRNREYAKYYTSQRRYRDEKNVMAEKLTRFLKGSYATPESSSKALSILRRELADKSLAEKISKDWSVRSDK